MRSSQAIKLTALLLLMGARAAGATDIYVGPSGSDGSAGTSTAPLRTIAAAVQAANPGDTVWLMAGQYRESLVPTRSGNKGQPITFKRAGQGPVVILQPSQKLTAIDIEGVTDIVVDGIDANGGSPPQGRRLPRSSRSAIRVASSCAMAPMPTPTDGGVSESITTQPT